MASGVFIRGSSCLAFDAAVSTSLFWSILQQGAEFSTLHFDVKE
jgi:hypothetical protein